MSKCVRGNSNLCMGCRTCLIACVEAHTNQHIFEIKSDSINFNPKLHMIKSYDITVPYQCRHCESPDCMKACKKGAIYKDEDRVLIDADKCDGCMDCMSACPFGAIDMCVSPKCLENIDGKVEYVANKCDLCKDNPDGPACVRVCPTGALKVVSTDEEIESAAEKRARQAYRQTMIGKWLAKKEDTELE